MQLIQVQINYESWECYFSITTTQGITKIFSFYQHSGQIQLIQINQTKKTKTMHVRLPNLLL